MLHTKYFFIRYQCLNICGIFLEGDPVVFSDLEKYTVYSVFVRAVSRQIQSDAENPNEEIVGNFSASYQIRTDQDGLFVIHYAFGIEFTYEYH